MSKPESIEEEFDRIAGPTREKIKEQLAVAEAAMDKAIRLSEDSGVPFNSDIHGRTMTYIPKSFHCKGSKQVT